MISRVDREKTAYIIVTQSLQEVEYDLRKCYITQIALIIRS